jgi:hypothetical protein
MKISIQQIAHHRNGVGGEPFYAVTFTCTEDGETRNMIATVFPSPGAVAVYDRDLLAAGNILFGENSWRGDVYEPALRRVIAEAELAEEAA